MPLADSSSCLLPRRYVLDNGMRSCEPGGAECSLVPALPVGPRRRLDIVANLIAATWGGFIAIAPLVMPQNSQSLWAHPLPYLFIGFFVFAILTPCWIIARLNAVARRIAQRSLRADLALTPIDPAEFLWHTLKPHLRAAVLPSVLLLAGAILYELVVRVQWAFGFGQATLANSHYHVDFGVHYLVGIGLYLLIVYASLASAGWLLRSRFRGAGSLALATYAVLGIVISSLGSLSSPAAFESIEGRELSMLAALAALFLAAAQFSSRKRLPHVPVSWRSLSVHLLVAVGFTVVLSYYIIADKLPFPLHITRKLAESEVLLTSQAVLLVLCLAVLAHQRFRMIENNLVLPHLTVAGISIAAGIWLLRPAPWPDLGEGLIDTLWYSMATPLAVLLPVAGLGILVPRLRFREAQQSTLARYAAQLLTMISGSLLGVLAVASTKIVTRSHFDAMVGGLGLILLLISATAAVLYGIRLARRAGDQPPRITALFYGIALTLALDTAEWLNQEDQLEDLSTILCINVAFLAVVHLSWRSVCRNFLRNL